MKHLVWIAVVAVAACGADGEPITPTGKVSASVSSSGVSTGLSVGITRGPVRIEVSR